MDHVTMTNERTRGIKGGDEAAIEEEIGTLTHESSISSPESHADALVEVGPLDVDGELVDSNIDAHKAGDDLTYNETS